MAHYGPRGPAQAADYLDEDEDDSLGSGSQHPVDRIRRNYVQENHQQANHGAGLGTNQQQQQQQDTIQVQLDEGYFANERRAFINLLANARQKCTSMQMFNPAKNQSIKEQQERWNEDEKYTLDSLNEARGGLDEQFQWSRPEDGRKVWSSKLQYFLAITSYSIGLGNVIRFPILVQKNGGLAFIIPFVIMLIVEGVPLFYLELAVGQRMRKAAISCWNLVSPFAAGIGVASAAVSFLVGLYYNTMVAWTLLYLWGAAARRPLPFAHCPSSAPNATASVAAAAAAATCQNAGPYQHYWFRQVLDASPDIDLWTNFNWPVFLALLLAWLFSYLCLFRGLANSKRVVYVASTFPYVILTIFFFKSLSLPGMSDGVYYLFAPEWSKLWDPYVWLQSAGQVFFSLGLGFGGLIALSSYNQVNNNCYHDALKVSLVNFCTSIYAGIVIFAILGYRAHLAYDKCLVEREQAIEYYLSDYNLKVLDYGSVFSTQLGEAEASNSKGGGGGGGVNNHNVDNLYGSANDYYDSNDAITSIRSLDKQLDSVSDKGSFDYGDSDTEFIIDASGMIDKEQLNKIVSTIPGLPTCSVYKELDAASQGTGLVFVVMAEAISQFKDAPMWATIFFLMLLTLGLDSQFGNLEGLLSSLADLNFDNSIRRQWMTGFICFVSLVISVIMFAHGAGSYMFAIFDEYASSFSLVLIAIFELLAISHIYGLKRFCDDCELMTGKRPPFIILLSWRYISPILLLIVTFATVRDLSVSLTYEAWQGDHLEAKAWPTWCITFALVLIIACVIWIPLVVLLRYLRISIIPEESLSQCWFPAEELREYHDLQEEHKVTKLERVLFGFRSDDD